MVQLLADYDNLTDSVNIIRLKRTTFNCWSFFKVLFSSRDASSCSVKNCTCDCSDSTMVNALACIDPLRADVVLLQGPGSKLLLPMVMCFL